MEISPETNHLTSMLAGLYAEWLLEGVQSLAKRDLGDFEDRSMKLEHLEALAIPDALKP